MISISISLILFFIGFGFGFVDLLVQPRFVESGFDEYDSLIFELPIDQFDFEFHWLYFSIEMLIELFYCGFGFLLRCQEDFSIVVLVFY